jgi:hypothetical protein
MTERINTKAARAQGEMTTGADWRSNGFKDPNVFYIGRKPRGWAAQSYDLEENLFHNPFEIDTDKRKRDGSREEVVAKFQRYLLHGGVADYKGAVHDGQHLLGRLRELDGKTLACWCGPDERCHGDVLIELIESYTPDITSYHTPAVAAHVGDCKYCDAKRLCEEWVSACNAFLFAREASASERMKEIRNLLERADRGEGVVAANEAVTAWELGDGEEDRPDSPDSAQWWLDHGISPEVREARPYERWRADDPDSLAIFAQRFAELLDERSLKNVVRKAAMSDGVIINRHPIPEHPQLADPRIAPEIRPDEPVYGRRKETHWHGYEVPPASKHKYRKIDPYIQSGPHKGGLIPHILRSKNEGIAKLLAKPKSKYMGDHFGVNTERVHYHIKPGKYQFPMNPTKRGDPYSHDHDADKKFQEPKRPPKLGKYSNYVSPTAKRERHVKRAHKGVDVKGEHEHPTWVEDRERGMAMRIDVHPAAMDKIRKEDVVFFGIEGCLKSDAILSAGGAVFSVPSVTLWQTPALSDFARRYLKGKTVIVVPDADGVTKPQVIVQALLCKSYLDRQGVSAAYVAAPPLSPEGEVRRTPDGSELKGVDDWLGFGGGTLDGLAVQTREAPELVHREFLDRFDLRDYGMYESSKGGMLKTLEGLALHHDNEGRYMGSVEMLCRVTGATKDRKPHKKPSEETDEERDKRALNAAEKRMLRYIRGLEKIGALTIDGELKLRRNRYNQTEYDRDDEEPDPAIELIEELQGWNLPPITVGELLGREGARGKEARRRLKEAG